MLETLYILKNKRTEEWIIVGSAPYMLTLSIGGGVSTSGIVPPPIPGLLNMHGGMISPEGWELYAVTGGGFACYFAFDKYGLELHQQRKLEDFEPEHQQIISEFKRKWFSREDGEKQKEIKQ